MITYDFPGASVTLFTTFVVGIETKKHMFMRSKLQSVSVERPTLTAKNTKQY
jgi:hypothetical protein